MNPHLSAIRHRIMQAPDSVSLERAQLVTEASRKHENEPVPLKRAKAFAHILANMTLDLDTNPYFAGNTSPAPRAWMLLPEYGLGVPGQAEVEHPHLKGFLDGEVIPGDLRAYWQDRSLGGHSGVGHLAVENDRLVREGLDAVIREAETVTGGTPDEQQYRQACKIACRAVIDWAERYADAAEAKANETGDAELAALHRRVAAVCRHVPAKPARNVFEALQSIALVHLAIHIEGHGYSVSPGRLDQILSPYLPAGDDAVELLTAFWLTLSANSLWGSHSKTQCITVGGTDEQGNDASNDFTLAILDACETARMPDPQVFLRWHDALSETVKQKAVAMLLSGISMPMLVGDPETIAGFVHSGIAERDAQNYCVIGCNELGVAGKLIFDSFGVPAIEALNEAISVPAPPAEGDGMDVVMARFESRLRTDLFANARNTRQSHLRRLRMTPTPFTSSLMTGCIERGKDMHEKMVYPLWTTNEVGFTTVVNSLAAIDTVIVTNRQATWSDLTEALANDFRGDDELRARLRAAPKWGNDDDRADSWAEAYLALRDRLLDECREKFSLPPILKCQVIRSLHNVKGAIVGATPDGRHAGAPLVDSIGAETGTARDGVTALLASVAKLNPSEHWTGGYNLNVTLPATVGEDGPRLPATLALIDTFFRTGGQELQINCLSSATLRKACDTPERYADLMVRVAGFNALFTRLGPVEQQEIITRAIAAER